MISWQEKSSLGWYSTAKNRVKRESYTAAWVDYEAVHLWFRFRTGSTIIII